MHDHAGFFWGTGYVYVYGHGQGHAYVKRSLVVGEAIWVIALFAAAIMRHRGAGFGLRGGGIDDRLGGFGAVV